MNTKGRLPITDENEIPRELAELGQRIAESSDPCRQDLLKAYRSVVDSVRRRRKILNLVQESLAQLRLDIKYLMFDLEVTRQERDELQKQLEDR